VNGEWDGSLPKRGESQLHLGSGLGTFESERADSLNQILKEWIIHSAYQFTAANCSLRELRISRCRFSEPIQAVAGSAETSQFSKWDMRLS